MAAKPAERKAKAISECPFTPCSRRMATRGLEVRERVERKEESCGTMVSRGEKGRL